MRDCIIWVRQWRTGWSVALALLFLAAGAAAVDAADERPDPARLRAILDQAREVSYTKSWQEAQAMLDELKPHVETFDLPELFDFHLLEARHLTLADRSREALERVGMLLAKPLDAGRRLRALQFGANVAVLLRDYEVAFDYLLEALSIESDVDEPTASIATFNMASYMFGKVGEHQRAIEYGQQAIEHALAHGDANDECIARQRVAPVYKWAGQIERAEAEYRQAIRVCSDIGNRLFAGVVEHGLADLLRRDGRLEEARQLALDAITALTESVFPLGEHEARLVLAETRYDLDLLDEDADSELADLAAYFRDAELWDQLSRLELLRARLAEGRGKPGRALGFYKQHMDVRERFLDRDRAMQLAYLEIAFDTRLKEQQIDLLEESARVARLETISARQQRQFRTVVLVLSAFVAVLLGILLFNAVRSRRHFQHLSRHDQLSGLANQAWFFDQAGQHLARARAEGGTVCLVVADIDHFKAINDRFGHLVGDDVLGQTARRLCEAFGDEALIGRIGGEEFAVLLADVSTERVVESIRRFQHDDPARRRAGDPPVTLSFGVARSRPCDGLTRLRQRADRALYQAKRGGRDRYVISRDETASPP